VARLKPRFNAEVNQWWLCDAGRYGFRWIDDDSRLTAPSIRTDGQMVETTPRSGSSPAPRWRTPTRAM